MNFAGLALLILGAGLIVLEFFMPAFGSLGIGGVVAFVLGSIMLFDDRNQGLYIALPIIAGMAVAGALIIGTIAWLASQARRRPIATGAEAMLGGIVESSCARDRSLRGALRRRALERTGSSQPCKRARQRAS